MIKKQGGIAMKALQEKILALGTINGKYIDVDSFLSHQVDVPFLMEMAEEFEKRWQSGVASIMNYCADEAMKGILNG